MFRGFRFASMRTVRSNQQCYAPFKVIWIIAKFTLKVNQNPAKKPPHAGTQAGATSLGDLCLIDLIYLLINQNAFRNADVT
jgi:hypothetical protein